MAKYLNPFNDFGGKYLFGRATRKKYTIHFLNALFAGRLRITDVTFKDKEHLGETEHEARHIFDVICTGDTGETFIVEFQIGHLSKIIPRSIVYVSKAMLQQVRQRGDYTYALEPVHHVVLTSGKLVGVPPRPEKSLRRVWLMEPDESEPFVNLLSLHYFEGAKFTLQPHELRTDIDKWLFIIKNLEGMKERPEFLDEPIFVEFFEEAEIAAMPWKEREIYEERLKIQRDNAAIREGERELGREEGREKGREEGREEEREKMLLVIKLYKAGQSIAEITEATGDSEEKVLNTIDELKGLGVL